jgi:hypothetical protein
MKLKKYLILKIILNKKTTIKRIWKKSLGQEILEADLNFFKASSKIVHEKGEKKRKIKGCMRYSGNNYVIRTACTCRER